MIFDRYALTGSGGDDYESALQQQVHRHHFTNGHQYMDVSDVHGGQLKGAKDAQEDAHMFDATKLTKTNANYLINYTTTTTAAAAQAAAAARTTAGQPHLEGNQTNESAFESRTQTERFLIEMARLNKPICDFDISKNGVYAKVNLRRGTCYGPFPLKYSSEPSDRLFSWEVAIGADFHGWLEPLPEIPTWLKRIRTVHTDDEVNLRPQVSSFLWYETTRDIKAGEEITIDGRQRQPINLKDSFFNGLGMPESIQSSDQYDGSASNCSEVNAGEEETTGEKTTTDSRTNDLSDDENGFDIRCEVCDRTFDNLERLDDHLVEAHHFRKDEFHCDLCSQRFCHRPSLLKHRALVHNDIRKYPCENCTKVFCDPLNLQRHIRAHHIGARSHACPECGKTFATSSGLKQHTHIHSSVKPFQCEVCFKAYTQFSNLCRHKRMHADCRMQIKCSKCGQSFSTVTSLSKHKRFCDSTNSAGAVPLRHTTAQAQRNGDLHSANRSVNPATAAAVAAAAAAASSAGNSCPTNIDMATPPNPFFFLRSAPSFFPGFPAAYGLHGMFPPASLQANNLPLLFSKPNMDIRLPEMPSLGSGAGLLTPNGFNHFNLGSQESLHSAKADAAPPTLTSTPLGESKMLHGIAGTLNSQLTMDTTSDDNSSCSMKHPIKLEAPTEHESNSNTHKQRTPEPPAAATRQDAGDDDDDNSNVHDDEKREVDVISVPMDAEYKSDCNMELPLDLSVNRQQAQSNAGESNDQTDGGCEGKAKPEKPHSSDEGTNSNQTLEVKDEDEQVFSCKSSPLPSASPGPTPTPSPPNHADTLNGMHEQLSSPMACPRPIHPVLLEEIYRTHALGAAFQRPFPFLAQMGGRQAFEQNMHQHSAASFPPEPAFREALRAVGISCNPLTASTAATAMATHKIKDRYTCKFCGKVFPRSANLTRHLRTHTGEQPYTCKYCDRAFSISSNLQRHVRNIHNKERPFRCHLCDRCFGQQTNLDRHLRKHEADSTGIGYGDSPSSNEADRDDSYFDEIRSFMGQVTYNEGLYTPTSLTGLESDMNLSVCDTENDLSTSDLTIVSDKEAKLTNEAIAAST